MKPPSKVKVGPHVYEIHLGGELLDAHAESYEQNEGNTLAGFTNRSKSYIVVNEHLSPSVERVTLLHEVMHAAWGTAQEPEKIDEEAACSRLDEPLLAVLRGNPKLVAYLTSP